MTLPFYPFRLRHRKVITMISKSILFLCAALMLANCCALGTDCAPASGAPVAWDGLGSAPTDSAQPVEPPPPPKKQARAKREIIIGPLNAATAERTNVRSKDEWEQDLAADRNDEASLKRKLKICSSC
ncbi:hypothetical protein [Bradyrhizobium erythrophlei]|uniref:hypothetical protein n=1 Tax=Bradyrhizobium erythrophlei TaxID=1437360 RepID=UPI0012AB95E7|nr:hypothetical protein [Bradyrhizobium erythrophlei]